jgi:nucleotide-binding universal stress UspA family protein
VEVTDMLRSLLVPLDGSPCSDAATTLALDWARRSGASLLGLGVVDETSIRRAEPVPLGAGAYKKSRDDARVANLHYRVAGVLAEFRARAAAAEVRAEVIEELGDPAERILWEAHRADIVVLGRETHFNFEGPEHRDATLAQVVRSSPCPMVVVPSVLRQGAGVLVAYGGGREAARTLQLFALLGLAAGETLDVITVHRDAAEARAIARAAADFLESHRVAYRVHTVGSSAAPAEVLLDEVDRRRPRLLVLGAHRDHPLRDLFATSVTRAVLRACPVPMFVGA